MTKTEDAILDAACCPAEGAPVGGLLDEWEKRRDMIKLVFGEIKVYGYTIGQLVDVMDEVLQLVAEAEPTIKELVEKVIKLIDEHRIRSS